MATIKGTAKKDKLAGTAKADTILGLGAADVLRGESGNDTIKGGAGDDVIDGGAGNDKLYGEAGKDKLIGGLGNDRLDGGAGDDRVNGGAGNDVVIAGLGADAQNGGTGIDTIDYSTSTAGVGVYLNAIAVNSGGAAGDTTIGFENVIGSAFQDLIFGSASANVLAGGAGDDGLIGLAGADVLIGGDGTDFLSPGDDLDIDVVNGGDGWDFVDYQLSSFGVVVDLELEQVGGGAAGDVLISVERIIGSPEDDQLVVDAGGSAAGGGGDDTLSGNRLASGALDQTIEKLSGGVGADKFEVHYNTGFDIITDFTPGAFLVAGDKLIFKASEFGNIQHSPDGSGASTALFNITGTVIFPTRAAPQFLFDQTSSVLYFDEDGTGLAFTAVPVAVLDGFHGALSHGGPLLSVDEFEII